MKLYKEKHPFLGMLQNLFINADGGFSIVYELLVSSKLVMQQLPKPEVLYLVLLDDVAVSTFNRDGIVKTSALIPNSRT